MTVAEALGMAASLRTGNTRCLQATIRAHHIVTAPAKSMVGSTRMTSERGIRTCTIVGSRLLPSTNSSYVSLASLSLSISLKILSTRWNEERPQLMTTRLACSARERGTHLLRCVFVHGELHHLTGHLVYRLDDLEHLLIGDVAVSVDVI